MALQTPASIRIEHDQIHAEMAEIREFSPAIADALDDLVEVMHPHFLREEEVAMPPLSLLNLILHDNDPPEKAEALAMTQILEKELPQMLTEHEKIKAAAFKVKQVGIAENNEQVAQFGDDVILHARVEEEVYYPAAILIGKYLKLTNR